MSSYTRLLIERRTGLCWEPVAHPIDDIPAALGILESLKEKEARRKYPGDLRLIRITTEIIKQEPTP